MKINLLSIGYFVTLLLSACGTPAGLERAIEGFAEAAEETDQALQKLNDTGSQQLTRIRHAQARAQENALGERVLIRPAVPNDCRFEAPGCELRLMTRQDFERQRSGDVEAGEEITIDNLIPNQLAVAQEITLYAGGLREIATADQTEAVRQGVESAMAGVCGLAGTLGAITGVGVAAKPACEAFRVPVISLAAFVYGEYQAQAKLSALRRATGEMQPLLERAAEVFSVSAEFALDGEIRRRTEAYDKAMSDWENSKTQENLTALLDAADHLDAALGTRAQLQSEESVFRAFAAAHKEIEQALRDREFDLSAAMAEVEQLVKKAKRLAQIAQEFETALEEARASETGS